MTVVRFLQPQNAPSPIVETEEGIAISVRLVQFRNAKLHQILLIIIFIIIKSAKKSSIFLLFEISGAM